VVQPNPVAAMAMTGDFLAYKRERRTSAFHQSCRPGLLIPMQGARDAVRSEVGLPRMA
jgi:hypothetical protein